MPKIVFNITVTLLLGQGQRSGPKSNFWGGVVDNGGSALLSTAKSH